MIGVLFPAMKVMLIGFCLLSYLICGYVAFVLEESELKRLSLPIKLFVWLFSPLLVLDIIWERCFGWSPLS